MILSLIISRATAANKMCRLLGLVLLAAGLFVPRAGLAETIEISIDHLPPYTIITEDGSVSGMDVDYVRYAAERIGLGVKFIRRPFHVGLAGLKDGTNEAMMPIFRKPEREVFAVIGQVAVQETDFRLYALEGARYRYFEDWQDLNGRFLAVVRGYRVSDTFDALATTGLFSLHRTSNMMDSLMALESGRVDFAVGSRHTFEYQARKAGVAIEQVGAPITGMKGSYLALSILAMSKREPKIDPFALMPQLDQALQDLRDEGQFAEIQRYYLGLGQDEIADRLN